MLKRTLVLFVIISLFTGCGKEVNNKDNQGTAKPEELVTLLMDEQYARIYPHFSTELKEIVSAADFETMMKGFLEGTSTLTMESELLVNGTARYVWVDETKSKGITAVWDPEGTIIGFQVVPLATYPDTDLTYTKNRYSFPIKGEWLVYWGGVNELTNYHYAIESQRYSLDLIQAEEGFSFEGDPTLNESYYAFGQEIIAPADGTVVTVVAGIEDNTPVGTMNEEQPAGNYVVIDHGQQEFSIIAHFQEGSIRVKEGDSVVRGDLLGLTGNSGNSSEPHIHFQVSDGPDLFTNRSIRIQFDTDVEVVQGETVGG